MVTDDSNIPLVLYKILRRAVLYDFNILFNIYSIGVMYQATDSIPW